MRLGTKSSHQFIENLNKKNEKIQNNFLDKIKKITKSVSTKVMLGDSTIIEQKTFDPNLTQDFFKKIINNIPNWETQDLSFSNNEDLKRIFIKFEIRDGNYLLSGHFSLQFHILLYYRSDNRVIQCQKELSEIIDKTKNDENELSKIGDQITLEKIKKMGFENTDPQNLFEIFYKNDDLREKIQKEIDGQSNSNFRNLSQRKIQLFNELDDLLIETYQTTPILIDDVRLVAGEEGCVCQFDLEFIKNGNKEGVFNPDKIPEKIKNKILKNLDQVLEIISF